MERAALTLLVAVAQAVLFSGCRPAPDDNAGNFNWERNPGLMPKPAGRILGEKNLAWSDENFANFTSERRGRAPQEVASLEEQFVLAADEGQAWAQTRLGVLYARAENDPARWEKAVRLLQLAAGQGDAEAQYELAGMAAAGRGMPASDVEAFEYMREAAARGLADAQYQLAAMHAAGRGTVTDKAAAAEWGRRAAEQDHTRAQFSLGCLLVEAGKTGQKAEGVEWLKRAALGGSRQAALFLAAALARGEYGLVKDEAESERLLRPLAEKDDGEAQFVLAWLYMFGDAFTDRRHLARSYLEMAARGGHQQAAAALKTLPLRE